MLPTHQSPPATPRILSECCAGCRVHICAVQSESDIRQHEEQRNVKYDTICSFVLCKPHANKCTEQIRINLAADEVEAAVYGALNRREISALFRSPEKRVFRSHGAPREMILRRRAKAKP